MKFFECQHYFYLEMKTLEEIHPLCLLLYKEVVWNSQTRSAFAMSPLISGVASCYEV